ncbi:hypothetical protein [Streptomyces sp. NPDC001781]
MNLSGHSTSGPGTRVAPAAVMPGAVLVRVTGLTGRNLSSPPGSAPLS